MLDEQMPSLVLVDGGNEMVIATIADGKAETLALILGMKFND